jgi:hypothetical protein
MRPTGKSDQKENGMAATLSEAAEEAPGALSVAVL